MDAKNTHWFDRTTAISTAPLTTLFALLSMGARKKGRIIKSYSPTLTPMQWIPLYGKEQLDTIDTASQQAPILIFKHSTRCSISSAALARLERAWTAADDEDFTSYHLDLLRHRDVSNAIAQRYNVEHASPQVLVIHNGKCIYSESHFGIAYAAVITQLKA